MATDPVCGMTVAAVESSLHLDHDGRRHYFCGTGCLRAFAAEPDRYQTGDGAAHEAQR
jgi:xanthine dehydrogenase accessory factor